MAIAGFCSQCGENAYLDANWSCPRGHGWNAVSGWYDTETGAAITPPWLQQAATPEAPPISVDPAPLPEPAPPPDPIEVLHGLIGDRLRELNLAVTEKKGVFSAKRGKEYECAVAVDGSRARILLWEHLREGRDPGVRDAVRALADNGWTLRIVLKRTDITG